MSAWAVILLMWAVTYPPRLLGLSLGRVQLPPFWQAFLRYVPVSVFAALVVPEVLGSPEWPRRLVGVLVAGLLYARGVGLAPGLLAGFAAYWAARLAGV